MSPIHDPVMVALANALAAGAELPPHTSPDFMLVDENVFALVMPHTDSKKCANSNKHSRCNVDAALGHMYCTNCRVATGGYLRYNSPARLTA